MCPLNSSIPITAEGLIPVAPSDVASIPSIALSIPDFEGEAVLRIFSNETHEQIACYSAVLTNGNSFAQPKSVGTVLGLFTLLALIASFGTAIYGEAIPTIRLHYAHSLSVGVVFAVWQHIYYLGALSVNWPSVLVAWWNNFAWAAGMIYSSSMQSSIDHLVGNNVGNTSEVGSAQSGSSNPGIGGGYDISAIYRRTLGAGIKRATKAPFDIASEIYGRDPSNVLKRDIVQRNVERAVAASESIPDASVGYKWYGKAVGPGYPIPGNYSGFAGTLAQEGIKVSNAFMTGFLWFLICLVLLVACVMALKWILEGLARLKWIKQDRLKFFRTHWLGYSAVAALRICFIAWFMIMFLTIFQFTYQSSGGVKAVAAIVFIIFFIGMPLIAGYAYWYKHHVTDHEHGTPTEHNKLMGGRLPLPNFRSKKQEAVPATTEPAVHHVREESKSESKPLWKRMASNGSLFSSGPDLRSIHDDEDYTLKFGWLAGRFRRTRWWFFAVWLFYEFLRAIFLGGASSYALAQVFGLLVIEFIAFCFIVWARPFEGQRLNVLVVYCLGFSKVTTVGLSAAFDGRFNLARITTTVIGIVIIVIQGILTIITVIAIIVGAISSYMSVSRNRENFRPRKWHGLREKYFDHLDKAVNDLPPEPKPEPPPPEEPKFGFEMRSVKRQAKIEDEDEEFSSVVLGDAATSPLSMAEDATTTPMYPRSGAGTPANRSRANSRAPSIRSMSQSQTNLPYGARAHRRSWSTKDFPTFDAAPVERDTTPVDTERNAGNEDEPVPPPRSASKRTRASSRGSTKATQLTAQPSTDSLHIGGDVSTRDTIGNVPAPTVRPRAGTGSRSQRNSFYGMIAEDASSSDRLNADASDSQPSNQQTSANWGSYGRAHPLTPALEMDEWHVSPKSEPSPQ